MGIYRNDEAEFKWDDFDCGFSDLGLVKTMCRLDCTTYEPPSTLVPPTTLTNDPVTQDPDDNDDDDDDNDNNDDDDSDNDNDVDVPDPPFVPPCTPDFQSLAFIAWVPCTQELDPIAWYGITNLPLPFNEAAALCKQWKGHLLYAFDENIDKCAANTLNTLFTPDNTKIRLGGRKGTDHGEWAWCPYGPPRNGQCFLGQSFSYENWNDGNGESGGDCMGIYKTGETDEFGDEEFKWDTLGCGDAVRTMCRIDCTDPNPPSTFAPPSTFSPFVPTGDPDVDPNDPNNDNDNDNDDNDDDDNNNNDDDDDDDNDPTDLTPTEPSCNATSEKLDYTQSPLTFPFHQTLLTRKKREAQDNIIFTYLLSDNRLTLTDIENLLKHGCWCAKLDSTNQFTHFLGGPEPVDDIDQVCKNWFKARHCNDHLIGGTCRSENNELLKSGSYSVLIDTGCLDFSECHNTDNICEEESCIIDLYYLNEIRDIMTEPNFILDFEPIQVTDDSVCVKSINNGNSVDHYCSGDAPYKQILVNQNE